MGKRKRELPSQDSIEKVNGTAKSQKTDARAAGPVAIQIVTGSYERVLHGFVATITSLEADTPAAVEVQFSNTFLFSAHSSSIRCLALSQNKESKKCILATGGSDERVNLYSISTAPILEGERGPNLPSLSATTILENPKNKELGSLMHHSRPVTKLHFPTSGKLFSAGEDNTIAITRSRDWTVLSAMKAPIPKPVGRPSGDTAAPGEVPAGVNDFAVHPSMKIMMSVGKGEKCMRLWNLVTGKKAGALNYGKDLLHQVGEGRFGAGEGRKVVWSETSDESDTQAELVVCFERAAAVFGEDCEPKAILSPAPATKIHDLQTVPGKPGVVAMSTEDGRVLFFNLEHGEKGTEDKLPKITPFAQIGGPDTEASSTRIKAFTFVDLPNPSAPAYICVTGSSDGSTRLWSVSADDLRETTVKNGAKTDREAPPLKKLGTLLATHQSGNRITCLGAFLMDAPAAPRPANDNEVDDEFAGFSSEDSDEA